jgi:hypothetical protein
LAIAGAILAVSPVAAASEPAARTYVIAIGYNGVPAGREEGLLPLRFADDDAISFFEFLSGGAARAHLLTVVDADTQRRLGDAMPAVQPPSVAGLRAAVADVRRAIDADARAGAKTTVYLYYSGHGAVSERGESSLTLLDGSMTREMLYDEVLAALPADQVHLFVDACHAEGVVRPRDVQAQVASLTNDDLTHYELTTLERFPNVGAVLASARNAQAHEWDVYQGGVFTHELLSGLRGAADVNGDWRIEYSELAAFLSAANREVRDPRARVDAVTRPPAGNPRAAIVELGSWSGVAVLEAPSARLNAFYVEDDRGERLADVRAESGHPVRVALPVGRTLYVRSAPGEVVVRPAPGQRIALEAAAFRAVSMQARGALAASLERGLFATPYGPSYYRGFVDHAADLVAVPLSSEAPEAEVLRGPLAPQAEGSPSHALGWSVVAAGGALAIGAGVFGALALQAQSDFNNTAIENKSSDAADRYQRDTAVAAVLGGAAVVAAGVGIYLLVRPHDRAPSATQLGSRLASLRFDF